MPHSAHSPLLRFRFGLRVLALLVLLPTVLGVAMPYVADAAPTGQAEQQAQQISTRYFTIYFPQGEEQAANWYAGFVDEVDTAVSEMLGSDPVGGLKLRIYATEAEYTRANPIAEVHPGVLAHAIPEEKEVGVAVERLRQVAPELARSSFRHEMTHIVAGELSGQNLPIAFQEGLAQYNELSQDRAQEVVSVLQTSQLLTWHDLNDAAQFRARMEEAYPESYSVMAFLAERYGMGKFGIFVTDLKSQPDWEKAFQSAYGKPIDGMEKEWKSYLPGFLSGGWHNNVLEAYDMSPSIGLYQAGQFDKARDGFAKSQALYKDLGRTEQAAQADQYLRNAQQAMDAQALADQARKALESYDYAAAIAKAKSAGQRFDSLKLDSQKARTDDILKLATQGSEAVAALDSARSHIDIFNLGQASSEVQAAGQAFAALGDAGRVDEANRLVSNLYGWQRTIGLGVIVAGGAVLLFGCLVVLRITTRRRVPRPGTVQAQVQTVQTGEEKATWL